MSRLSDLTDVNKGYSPDNCRWATAKEQSNNTRANRRFSINGISKTLKEWSEEYSMDYDKVKSRIYIGWSIEEALGIVHRRN